MNGVTVKVEVRRCEIETFTGVSKKTGVRQQYHVLSVGCEILNDGSPLVLRQFLPDGATAANTKLPFSKGEKIEFQLKALTTKAGVMQGDFVNAERIKA